VRETSTLCPSLRALPSGRMTRRIAAPVLRGAAAHGTRMTISAPTRHFKIAWAAFRANWNVFVLSVFVLLGSWAILEVAVTLVSRWGVLPNLALHVIFLFLFSGLLVGIQSMALKAVRGSTPALRTLTSMLDRGPSFLLALCLYLVAVISGLALLVLPGLYIAVRYALFGYVIASRRVSGIEALRQAARLSERNRWRMFSLMLMALALNLAGAALLGVGLVISFPVSLLAAANFFRSLQKT